MLAGQYRADSSMGGQAEQTPRILEVSEFVGALRTLEGLPEGGKTLKWGGDTGWNSPQGSQVRLILEGVLGDPSPPLGPDRYDL